MARGKLVLANLIKLCLLSALDARYIGGYYMSGSMGRVKPSDLDANLSTHIYLAFLDLQIDGSLVMSQEDIKAAKSLSALKTDNPDLKLLFSVTGKFQPVAANRTLRATFVENALDLIKHYEFDGVDLDWEYPKTTDKANFIGLLKDTRREFKQFDYLVTAAVRPIPLSRTTGYDVPEMAKYLDIFNVMMYDFYGAWSQSTGLSSPLYASPLDSQYERKYLNIDASIDHWIVAGAPREKLAIGLPFYGRTFKLVKPDDHGTHAPSAGAGKPASLTYAQILEKCQDYVTEWDDAQKGAYKHSNTSWISYETPRSVTIKTKYAKDRGLFGVFVWHLAGDNVNGQFSGKKQELLRAINDAYDAP